MSLASEVSLRGHLETQKLLIEVLREMNQIKYALGAIILEDTELQRRALKELYSKETEDASNGQAQIKRNPRDTDPDSGPE